MKKHNRFEKGSGVYVCACCGKKTRATDQDSAGVGLCHLCYEVAGFENMHSDDGHEGILQDCEICKEQMNEKYIKHAQEHPELFS